MTQDSESPSNGSTNVTEALAVANMKMDQALRWQTLLRGNEFLKSISDAEAKSAYGAAYHSPENDDVIAIESPTTTTINHNYARAMPETQNGTAAPASHWLGLAKIAVLIVGLATLAGVASRFLAHWLPTPHSTPNASADPGIDRRYKLDFWDPTELSKARQ